MTWSFEPGIIRALSRAVVGLLVILLVVGAVEFSTAEPASAHKGHKCSGQTIQRFRCVSSAWNNDGSRVQATYVYSKGQYRGYGFMWKAQGTRYVEGLQVCDTRLSDAVSPYIQLEYASGNVLQFGRPDDCRWYEMGTNARRWRVVMRKQSNGNITHATKWRKV